MSEIKTSLPGAGAVAGAAVPATSRQADVPGVEPVATGRPYIGEVADRRFGGTDELLAAFSAPPQHVRAWLADPKLGAVLQEISQALAPDGVAADPQSRYAASVIETHLSARRHLASRLNALIRA